MISNSPMKSEQTSKRAKISGAVQRNSKEVRSRRAVPCATMSPRSAPRLLSLNCMECRPDSRSLVVLLVCALALSCTICPYVNTPTPVLEPVNRGAQIEAMLRPNPPASTATASSEQTGGAGKILVKSKSPTLLTSAGNYPPSNRGILISATPFLRLNSACLQFLSGRSPPGSSYTQL